MRHHRRHGHRAGGAALLFTPEAGAVNHKLIVGFLVLQIGMAGWSFGSIIQRRKAGRAHSVVAGGVQQLAAGISMIRWRSGGGPDGSLEHAWSVGHPVPGGVWFAGGIQRLRVRHGHAAGGHRVDLSLRERGGGGGAGMAVLREPFGWRETAAMVVIFAGVAVVKRYPGTPAARTQPASRR